MTFSDFFYDGSTLSEHGYILGSLGNGNDNIITAPNVTFNTTSAPNSQKHYFISSKVEDTLQFNFQIFKNPCGQSKAIPINRYEDADLHKWLAREDGFHKFAFVADDGYEDIYHYAYINLAPIEVHNEVFGFTVTVTTNSAYGFSHEETYEFDLSVGEKYEVYTSSDKQGYIYPKLEITPYGDVSLLTLKLMEDSKNVMQVHNMKSNKIVTLDSEKKLLLGLDNPSDFEWYFLRLLQGYDDTINTIYMESGGKCHFKLSYIPLRKVVY